MCSSLNLFFVLISNSRHRYHPGSISRIVAAPFQGGGNAGAAGRGGAAGRDGVGGGAGGVAEIPWQTLWDAERDERPVQQCSDDCDGEGDGNSDADADGCGDIDGIVGNHFASAAAAPTTTSTASADDALPSNADGGFVRTRCSNGRGSIGARPRARPAPRESREFSPPLRKLQILTNLIRIEMDHTHQQ
jgi:hypothetical protein